jgi:hypothetical protein
MTKQILIQLVFNGFGRKKHDKLAEMQSGSLFYTVAYAKRGINAL